MKIKYFILLLLLALGSTALAAEDREEKTHKKAWEFGLGGTVWQFNRVSFSNFTNLSNGYQFDLSLKHAVYGGNIYIARELSNHFYVDFQGSVGATKHAIGNSDKTRWLYTAGLGIQWRLGEYFNSSYIDPYLRVGASYMRKEFDILYAGTEGMTPAQMEWIMSNMRNKDGADRKNLIPITAGLGINMWLNDHWGIGLQGDYVFMPYSDVANSLQGTVRLMYRLGGKSKKPVPQVQYVDREIERIVEKKVEVPVRVVVEKEADFSDILFKLLSGINFDFDEYIFSKESYEILDGMAKIMKEHTDKRFLITGFTDAKGSDQYNLDLSDRRAKAVVNALIQRGVPSYMLKARGVGKRIAVASTSASDQVRHGDRKVTIELIDNADYWEYLTQKGY